MDASEIKPGRAGSTSMRIIAAGMVVGFCYWAASVVMTLLLSILLAYFLDPFVEWLERFRLPRAVGALIVVLITLSLLAALGLLVWDRVESFAADWPTYSAVLKQASVAIEQKIARLEARVSEIAPKEDRGPLAIRVAEERPIRSLLLRGLGSLYSILFLVTFVPFLVFFMLAAKRDVWHGTMQLFPPTKRTGVKHTLEEVSAMLRSYVVGNLLVFGILAVVSWLFFWIIGLDYPLLTGMLSGFLNLVPYVGVVLAWFPPLVMGLVKYNSVAPFLAIAGVLALFHLIAINVLVPALVGKKVHLNALAVTLALLFWGWLWGGIGLILAIPITATIKVVCDHVEGWEPVGRWLGA